MSNIALILKGQKILFQNFLVTLGENFLEFYLLLSGLFFLNRKDNKISIAVHFSLNDYLELELIVLNHV